MRAVDMFDVVHHLMEEDLLRSASSPNVESPIKFITTVRQAIYRNFYLHDYTVYQDAGESSTTTASTGTTSENDRVKSPQVQRTTTRPVKPYVPPTSDDKITSVVGAPLE